MNNRYIKFIDGLRVIALFGVFVYHLLGMYVPSGYLGVVIFFTLAGFLSMNSEKHLFVLRTEPADYVSQD